MKSRRVTVTLEIETDAPLKVLRDKKCWVSPDLFWVTGIHTDGIPLSHEVHVLQAQANVIRQGKGKR